MNQRVGQNQVEMEEIPHAENEARPADASLWR